MNHVVYVLDKHGKPLMPTKRFGHVRRLMRSGRAVPVCDSPFTIRLKYDSTGFVQKVHEGLDVGRENIGNGASLENGECILLEDIRTNNKSIKKAMKDRAAYRRERRRHRRQRKQRAARRNNTELKSGKPCIALGNKQSMSVSIKYPGANEPTEHKVIRGKEGKFNNRKREDGWLTPSARQLIQMLMCVVEDTIKILPVSHLHIERNAFDFQKLENEDIRDWQHGKLFGFNGYKDYIDHEQHSRCAICGAPISQYHHITPRKAGGIDNVGNIIGLCDRCHREVHNNKDAAERLLSIKKGLVQEYQVGLLNSVMPDFIEKVREFCDKRGIEVIITEGHNTKDTRDRFNLPKDHSIDGYAISLSDRACALSVEDVRPLDTVIIKRRFKKKSGGMISARGKRIYKFGGKIVAYNRHKAMDQKEDSLEDYMAAYAKTHTAAECTKHFSELEIVSAKRIYTYHKLGLIPDIRPGDVVRYEKHNKVRGNTKKATVAASSVSYKQENSGSFEWHVSYGEWRQNFKAKYCHRISSGCIQTVKVSPVMEVVEEAEKQAEAMKKKRTEKKKDAA